VNKKLKSLKRNKLFNKAFIVLGLTIINFLVLPLVGVPGLIYSSIGLIGMIFFTIIVRDIFILESTKEDQ